jgi:hypothetical protein
LAQERAIVEVKRLGGTVEIDEQSPQRSVVKVDLHASAVEDADLAHLAALTELRHLDLRSTKIGDAGVAHFEATAGAIDDPTFVRPPQGAHEEREGFE